MLKETILACILLITISYAYPTDLIQKPFGSDLNQNTKIRNDLVNAELSAEADEIFETAEANYHHGHHHHGHHGHHHRGYHHHHHHGHHGHHHHGHHGYHHG